MHHAHMHTHAHMFRRPGLRRRFRIMRFRLARWWHLNRNVAGRSWLAPWPTLLRVREEKDGVTDPFEWHSSKEQEAKREAITRQDTQRIRALTTQELVDRDRGEVTDPSPLWRAVPPHCESLSKIGIFDRNSPVTDKVPAYAAEHARRMHMAYMQRQVTAPMKRFQTKVLLDAYNAEAHKGRSPKERTTAALERITTPPVVSPIRARAQEHEQQRVGNHVKSASADLTKIPIVPAKWPRQRNTLHSIRLRSMPEEP